jgi:hypothetical protein
MLERRPTTPQRQDTDPADAVVERAKAPSATATSEPQTSAQGIDLRQGILSCVANE